MHELFVFVVIVVVAEVGTYSGCRIFVLLLFFSVCLYPMTIYPGQFGYKEQCADQSIS